MTTHDERRDLVQAVAKTCGWDLEPARIEEAAAVTAANVAALRRAFRPEPMTGLPEAFPRLLSRSPDE